ncbi:MAG TPA: insulinase family protein [Polyangia bacterium]|nr:insulinase family protein [Polyangia bacterium]
MRGALALMAALALGCGTANFSPYPPPRRGAPKLWVPAFTTTKLPNGLQVSVNPDNYLPLTAIAVGIRGGALLDPPSKAGLTRLLAEMLTTRADQLPRLKLMTVYDSVGDGVRAEVTPDGIILSLEVLEDRAGAALAMLAHLLQHPDFDPDELERLKAIGKTVVTHDLADPDTAAMRAIRQVVFGGQHPAGAAPSGTHRSLDAITIGDLRARYEQIVRPDNIVIGVAGRVEPEMVNKAVAARFASWKAPATPLPAARTGAGPEPARRQKIYFLPRPALSQTVICVGSRGLPESDQRYQLLRMITGRAPASASSWLRGVEQVTYGVRTIDEASTQTGLYGAYLSVEANATGSALKSMLDRYDAQPEGSFDIEKVVVLTIEGRPFFTLGGRARHVASLFVRGLPVDHFTRLRERLDEDRGLELPNLVFDYMKSDRMQVVLVGDPAVIKAQVPPLGEGDLEELRLAE